jgi:hypothetical protein
VRARAELRLVPDHWLKDLPFHVSTVLNERDKPFWQEQTRFTALTGIMQPGSPD